MLMLFFRTLKLFLCTRNVSLKEKTYFDQVKSRNIWMRAQGFSLGILPMKKIRKNINFYFSLKKKMSLNKNVLFKFIYEVIKSSYNRWGHREVVPTIQLILENSNI